MGKRKLNGINNMKALKIILISLISLSLVMLAVILIAMGIVSSKTNAIKDDYTSIYTDAKYME